MKKIDETNRAIIRHLADGRKPYSAIAEELSITENTVRARVNKLMEEGVLQITGLVNPEFFPGLQIVLMGVKLKTLDLGRKAQEFSRLRGVVSAVVVTGRYDLILQVILSEDEGLSLLSFFKKELAKVPEILEVETFVVYQSYNYSVPFIL
ncbi:MAG: Lrp/AsnC family transcriptional regulator [Sphaerochaetaceae bacterium]|jgi:Lrp/AsnC family transcriptional regulator for asnA, asnC and gidA|nr:Lrp/AsnC family transcriptional regulator [Sphaerochaetaceae bacterium]MDD4218725.1 Lrp/AsnC family transcriptional regulator [Sphaerochaetaceae bacterium]MDY0371151.1 Lrp/AsnC family transcriptional regulator [Sphaerochaetaceae bacterium]